MHEVHESPQSCWLDDVGPTQHWSGHYIPSPASLYHLAGNESESDDEPRIAYPPPPEIPLDALPYDIRHVPLAQSKRSLGDALSHIVEFTKEGWFWYLLDWTNYDPYYNDVSRVMCQLCRHGPLGKYSRRKQAPTLSM